ncbi:MAG: Ubiquitin carboxyl-terminal hydrolase [Amphiamblys sp. WSBS2006]|nr:MAG: Ubiquitin carboxyl-terminal hydrolase [Amphiamblys sp. WSBS2006]
MGCSHFDKELVCDMQGEDKKCSKCSLDSREDLWRCLRCGFVGCGRYTQGKHAELHRIDTGHSLFYNHHKKIVWCYVCECGIPVEEDTETEVEGGSVGDVLTDGRVGLTNLGNTCYMNSGLQTVIHAFAVSCYVFYSPESTADKLRGVSGSFIRAVRDLFTTDAGVVSPRELHRDMRKVNSCFGDYTQQDSMDFVRALLSEVHDGTKRKTEEKSVFGGQSFVSDIFGGRLKSVVKCQECGSTSKKIDAAYDIAVEIAGGDAPGFLHKTAELFYDSSSVKLEACLDSFFSEEVLKGSEKFDCSKCKRRTNAKKRFSLVAPTPNTLIVQLKRFRAGGGFFTKIKKKVEFPGSIDLGPYTTDKESTPYDLVGVVVHHGSFGSGHYTAYCRDSEGWSHYDDTRVRRASVGEVFKAQCYILVYQKKSHSKAVCRLKKALAKDVGKEKKIPRAVLAEFFCRAGERLCVGRYVCSHGGYFNVEERDLVSVSSAVLGMVVDGRCPSAICPRCDGKSPAKKAERKERR